MRKYVKNNSLSLVFLLLFFLSLTGQIITGFIEYKKEHMEKEMPFVSGFEYLGTGHFLESTFENWESEFLQMTAFVLLTIFLQQKGSSESKNLDKKEEVDREPSPRRKGAPPAVRAGGWILSVYKYSLTLVLTLLFLLSFILHLYGSLKDENEKLAQKGISLKTIPEYILDSRFWFESFQNWQSEFLSVFAIVLLSVFLRQKGSSQSKPVDAPHIQTGTSE